MPHAVVITQVDLDEHGHGVVTCRQCGVTGPLTLADIREARRGHTFPVTYDVCHHVFRVYFVCRHHRRQPVMLPGLLYALHTHQPLDTITVTSLSEGGISFQTRHQIGCQIGERYAVVFGRTEKPTFKGVWDASANFAALRGSGTRHGRYPLHHRPSDDTLVCRGLGRWAADPPRTARA